MKANVCITLQQEINVEVSPEEEALLRGPEGYARDALVSRLKATCEGQKAQEINFDIFLVHHDDISAV